MNRAEMRISKAGITHPGYWRVVIEMPGMHADVECPTWSDAFDVAQHWMRPLLGQPGSLPGTIGPSPILKPLADYPKLHEMGTMICE